MTLLWKGESSHFRFFFEGVVLIFDILVQVGTI